MNRAAVITASNLSFKGIYEFMNEKIAQELVKQNIHLWNWQQDLNLEGLRKLKLSYRPIDFLKKFTVSVKT